MLCSMFCGVKLLFILFFRSITPTDAINLVFVHVDTTTYSFDTKKNIDICPRYLRADSSLFDSFCATTKKKDRLEWNLW